MKHGYWSLVLHAHLPFVRHPEHDFFLEELWFFEAITETYLPLLAMIRGHQRDGIHSRITMSVTPPLAEMMRDPMLISRYGKHLRRLVELAEREVGRTHDQPHFQYLANFYLNGFRNAERFFHEDLQGDLVGAFRLAAASGHLELMTCSATHGFLPFLRQVPGAVHAQVATGVEAFRRTFGFSPRMMWNAECGYFPGLDVLLRKHGIEGFVVDTHGLVRGQPTPHQGIFAPIRTPAGPYAFGRDMESSVVVWSAEEGYPGDPVYRDFYRDVGYDLHPAHLGEALHPDGIRHAVGMKYYRVTGDVDLGDKQPYDPYHAFNRAREHGAHFTWARSEQVKHLASYMDRPHVVSPYDAELYGHWWFEGVAFLDQVFRTMVHSPIQPVTLTEYMDHHPDQESAQLPYSSWGEGGYGKVWLNGTNDWIWRHIHHLAERMNSYARKYASNATEIESRILNQMGREVLLQQSSDWPFIMKTGTTVEYAAKRVVRHSNRFFDLETMLSHAPAIDLGRLAYLEDQDRVFPWLDFRVFID